MSGTSTSTGSHIKQQELGERMARMEEKLENLLSWMKKIDKALEEQNDREKAFEVLKSQHEGCVIGRRSYDLKVDTMNDEIKTLKQKLGKIEEQEKKTAGVWEKVWTKCLEWIFKGVSAAITAFIILILMHWNGIVDIRNGGKLPVQNQIHIQAR
jgi:hypothetical protein